MNYSRLNFRCTKPLEIGIIPATRAMPPVVVLLITSKITVRVAISYRIIRANGFDKSLAGMFRSRKESMLYLYKATFLHDVAIDRYCSLLRIHPPFCTTMFCPRLYRSTFRSTSMVSRLFTPELFTWRTPYGLSFLSHTQRAIMVPNTTIAFPQISFTLHSAIVLAT